MVFAIFIIKALVVIFEIPKHHNASGLLVSKEGKALISVLLQISEADDIAESLDRVEFAVGAGESLQQSMHAQVLIHP